MKGRDGAKVRGDERKVRAVPSSNIFGVVYKLHLPIKKGAIARNSSS